MYVCIWGESLGVDVGVDVDGGCINLWRWMSAVVCTGFVVTYTNQVLHRRQTRLVYMVAEF